MRNLWLIQKLTNGNVQTVIPWSRFVWDWWCIADKLHSDFMDSVVSGISHITGIEKCRKAYWETVWMQAIKGPILFSKSDGYLFSKVRGWPCCAIGVKRKWKRRWTCGPILWKAESTSLQHRGRHWSHKTLLVGLCFWQITDSTWNKRRKFELKYLAKSSPLPHANLFYLLGTFRSWEKRT